jgi:hypothetical protein
MRLRALLVLLLLAAPAAAQNCPGSLSLDLTDTWAHLTFETDTPGTASRWRTWYGLTVSLANADLDALSGHATEATRWTNLVDLGPGQKVYFDPRVSDAAGTYASNYTNCAASLCPDGAGVQTSMDPDISCEDDGGGDLIPFFTMAADAGAIAPPAAATLTRTLAQARTVPTITGATINVASGCTDFQAALDDVGDAGTKDPNLNHEIVLPAGTFCRAELETSPLANYTLPAKTGTGVTVIRCGWASDFQVPSGLQYTPTFRNAQSCGFELNRTVMGANGPWANNGALFNSGCSTNACTKGWYFDQLVIDVGDWRDQTFRQVPVSAVDTGTGVITTSSSMAGILETFQTVTLNLPGITGNNLGSDIYARGVGLPVRTGPTTMTVGASSWTGSYAGGGFLSSPVAFEISGCTSDGTDSTCTLEAAHGFRDFEQVSISGDIASGVLALASGHGLTAGAEVIIAGNSACNGRYAIASVTATSATLAGSSCTGTGGTVQRTLYGRFFDLEGTGAAALDGAHAVQFPAADQVKALDVDLTGLAITAGGFEYATAGYVRMLFELIWAQNVTLSRIHWQGSPAFRFFVAVNLSSNGLAHDLAVVDNYAQDWGYWHPIGARAGIVDLSAQPFSPASAAARFFNGNSPADVRIANFTLRNSPSWLFFSDQSGSPGATNIVLESIHHVFNDEDLPAGAEAPANIAFNTRHSFEVKDADRIEINGYHVKGWPTIGVANSYALYFSYWCTSGQLNRKMVDVTAANIWLEADAVGLGIVHNCSTLRYQEWWPIQRFSIDNLLADGLPYPSRQGAPHGDFLILPGTYASTSAGGLLTLFGPMEDIRITRVTGRRLQSGPGWSPQIDIAGQRSNGIQIDNSILGHSGSASQGLTTYDFNLASYVPAITADGEDGWRQWASWAGVDDARSWIGAAGAKVGVIPCLEAPNDATPNYAAANNAKTNADAAWACTDCSRWDIAAVVGSDGESCATREAAVLDTALDGQSTFAGLGADTAELYAALGYGLDVDISSLTTTTGTIGYTVPSGTPACTVDHGLSATFASGYTRAIDSGSGTSRSVAVSGYSAGQTVYYRVLCSGLQQALGSFLLGS